MVCATNSLLYLNQSVPPYGVSLNSIADHSTDFPLSKNQLLNASGHITVHCSVHKSLPLLLLDFVALLCQAAKLITTFLPIHPNRVQLFSSLLCISLLHLE